MPIDRFKPLIWPDLKKIGRDPYRLQTIMQIRNSIKPDLTVIDSESKRAELVFRYWMRENDLVKQIFADVLHADPDLFRKLNLTSPDTIMKDNRELERHGYYQKPKDLPKVEGMPLDVMAEAE